MSIEFLPVLAGLVASIAKDIGTVTIRSFLSQGNDLVERAINATCSHISDIEGARTNLQKWTSCEAFSTFFERVHAGEQVADEDIVQSFISEGDFYFPTDEESSSLATEIITWFLLELRGALYRSEEGLVVHANRQEVLHRNTRSDIKSHTTAVFAELEAKIDSLVAGAIAVGASSELESNASPAGIEMSQKIDLARDLIKKGKVHSARTGLELLISDNESVPDDLRFRIVTNLGACAMAEGNAETAISCFNEAHALQPDNQLGIGNAALAAQLSGNRSRARELAIRARESDPRDSQATYVLVGELWEEESEDLDALLSAEEWIKQDKRCALVLSRVRIHQSRFGEAVELCRYLVEIEPGDAATHLALSECLLTYALSDRMNFGSGLESLERIHEAESQASIAIDLLSETELRVQRRGALVARAAARALLGAASDAMKDLEEVLAEAPEHPDALLNKGLLLLGERRPEEARAALEGTRNSERFEAALLPLAQACFLAGDESAAVELLRDTFSLEHPEWDDVLRAEILYRAQAAAGDKESAMSAIQSALQRLPGNPRILALEYVRCEILDDLAGAEESLLKALECSGAPDRREILIRLGILYQNQGRFSEAADKYIEDVDGQVAHPTAIPLLMCLVNGKRLREALEWARKIRELHPQPPRIAMEVEADILNFVGDARGEVSCRQVLCSDIGATSVDRVKLALSQFRTGERDAALATVAGIRVSELHQTPKWLLTIAQLKLLLGVEGYLGDAYLARRLGINDPDVHIGYFGLFLGHDRDWVEPEAVSPGCAVLLKNEEAEQWWLLVEEDEEPQGPYELPHDNGLTLKLLGRRVGDSVVLREGIEDLSYEVVTVQSKYVRVLQETAAEFSTRFPGHMGMSRVSVEDNDFTKIFGTINQRDQMVRELERIYLKGTLPFVSLSSLLGRSVPEVWLACTANSFVPVRFSAGGDEKQNSTSEFLQEADVVVLDLVSLLTVHQLGLAEKLRCRFPRIAIPQLVIDELQKLHAETSKGPHPGKWLGKSDDGQYTLTEISEENWNEWRRYVESILKLAESFDRIPSYKLLDLDEVEALVDALTPAGAGALFASPEQSDSRSVLVSDDLGLARVGSTFGTTSVHSQAILEDLRRSDFITGEEYSAFIERLILMKYWFVRIRAEDVVRRLEAHGYMTTEGSRAMLQTLEGPDCDENSAVLVATDVLIQLVWRVPVGEMNVIISLVVETLKRGRPISPVLLKLRHSIDSKLASSPDARDMLLGTIDLHIGLERHLG